jgi:hypothetical protein
MEEFPYTHQVDDPARSVFRIWASDNFERTFLLTSCSEVSVSDDSVELTLASGERYLLVEEGPIA